MGRPKKEQPASENQEAPEVEAPAMSKQEIVLKVHAEKKAALAKQESELSGKLKKLSEEFMAGTSAPLFVPYKDRDGKTVPALVLGLFQTEKRDPQTNELVLDKNREVQSEIRASVWVFSNMSEPHRAVYHLPN